MSNNIQAQYIYIYILNINECRNTSLNMYNLPREKFAIHENTCSQNKIQGTQACFD